MILCAAVAASPLVAADAAWYVDTSSAPGFPAEVEERASDSELEERRGKHGTDEEVAVDEPPTEASARRHRADGAAADKARHTDELGRAAHGLRAPPA